MRGFILFGYFAMKSYYIFLITNYNVVSKQVRTWEY